MEMYDVSNFVTIGISETLFEFVINMFKIITFLQCVNENKIRIKIKTTLNSSFKIISKMKRKLLNL
jgi:hypothetical protein